MTELIDEFLRVLVVRPTKFQVLYTSYTKSCILFAGELDRQQDKIDQFSTVARTRVKSFSMLLPIAA